jgi:hypothetical protein
VAAAIPKKFTKLEIEGGRKKIEWLDKWTMVAPWGLSMIASDVRSISRTFDPSGSPGTHNNVGLHGSRPQKYLKAELDI